MSQTSLKYVRDSSSSAISEKLKLYENENKLLRSQLSENSKLAETELFSLKEKLLKEIKTINEKELEFKLQKQQLEENIAKITKEKGVFERKLLERDEENRRIYIENEGIMKKIKEISQENSTLKKQIIALERGKDEQELKISAKEHEELKAKNKDLEEKLQEILNNKKNSEMNIQKIFEEYNKILENYSILTKKLEEKEHEISDMQASHTQSNESLKKELKQAHKDIKLLQSEKQNFKSEIHTVKNDLLGYENSARGLKQCQTKLDRATKLQNDILRIVKKDGSKALYNTVYQMILKGQNFKAPIKGKKPLNIEDLNNSKISMKSEKNTKKCNRSLSFSNKSQASKKSNTPQVNTSMFCLHKRPNSPLIKCQKFLSTENSSHKKKGYKNVKSNNQSPRIPSSNRKKSEGKSQCLDPGWANEKLCDIQNILNASNIHNMSNSKENSHLTANISVEQRKIDEKKRIEKMDYQDLSEEIFVLEKHLTQLKKDYKTLLARSRSEENPETIRNELNEMAKDLEYKTETLIYSKKQLKKKLCL